MPESRRHLLTLIAGATGVIVARPLLLAALPPQMSPQPVPSPHAPNPNFPPGLDGPDINPNQNKQGVNPQNQKEIRADVEQLYQLASELKNQVEKTDLNAMLPLSLVKQTKQIEKLAKKIGQLSKG